MGFVALSEGHPLFALCVFHTRCEYLCHSLPNLKLEWGELWQ
jgi:hypothetical protein